MTEMEQNQQADVLRRLRCIEGHVRGVARMIEDGEDCLALLLQIKALHGALAKVSQVLMREHLTNCVPEKLDGDDRAELQRNLAEVSDLILAVGHK